MKEPLHTELLLFLYVSHIVIVNNFEFKYPLEHAWNVEEGNEMRNQDTDATTKEWKLNRNFFLSPCDRVQGQKRRGGEE